MNRTLYTLATLAILLLGTLIVFTTKIGPVIYVISETGGHGVHSGDLIVIPLGLIALYTAWKAIQPNRTSTR